MCLNKGAMCSSSSRNVKIFSAAALPLLENVQVFQLTSARGRFYLLRNFKVWFVSRLNLNGLAAFATGNAVDLKLKF